MGIYPSKNCGSPVEQGDTDKAIARGAAWIAAAQPVSGQDKAFRLMGLAWASANPAVVSSSAKALAAAQRADGGWSQLPTMGSDAYATGQALYALNIAGRVAASDPVYAKGVKYLLRTQAGDGSWHVKTRSIWIQPYFESGFPYGHDQWISAAGTGWATIALIVAIG